MTIPASSADGHKPPEAPPFSLRKLDIPDTDKIDGVKIVVFGDMVTLLYSVQEAASPAGARMLIRAVAVSDPSTSKVMDTVTKLLPARVSWDVRRNTSGSYDLVFEEAGGALTSLMFRDAAGRDSRISVSYPFESFFRPHFVRSRSGELPQVAATVDKKKVVVFPTTALSGPARYEELTEGADAIVGQGRRSWVLVKNLTSGRSLFDVLPGTLSIVWQPSSLDAKASRRIPFPDFVAFEFDATNLRDDVVVFATSKPAVLLRASVPAKAIHLAASKRIQLSKLSSPSVVVGSEFVHVAAIANRGTGEATVLYGAFPIGQLIGS